MQEDERPEVWHVPADDGSGDIVEIRPVTVTPPISPPSKPPLIDELRERLEKASADAERDGAGSLPGR